MGSSVLSLPRGDFGPGKVQGTVELQGKFWLGWPQQKLGSLQRQCQGGYSQKGVHTRWVRWTWIGILALAITSNVVLGKSLNLSLGFFILRKDITHRIVRKITECVENTKHSAWTLVKCSINHCCYYLAIYIIIIITILNRIRERQRHMLLQNGKLPKKYGFLI